MIEQQAVFVIAATVTLSLIYFLVLEKMKDGPTGKTRRELISRYVWRKANGFLILGVIPFALVRIFFKSNLLHDVFIPGNSLSLWPWITGVSIFLSALCFATLRLKAIQSCRPFSFIVFRPFPANYTVFTATRKCNSIF